MQKIESFSVKALALTGCILFLLLTAYSLLYTTYFETSHADIPSEAGDSPAILGISVLVMMGVLFLCVMVCRRLKKRAESFHFLLLMMVLLSSLLFSAAWIHLAKSTVVADQRSICFIAEQLLKGELSAEELRYLKTYPHQAGMVLLLEGIFLLFGTMNFEVFKYLNVLGVLGCILIGERLTRKLCPAEEAFYMYLLLCLGCTPLYVYTSFVYGEILSLFFALVAVDMFLEYCKNGKRRCLLLLSLSLSFSVLLRSNNYIVLIAIVCVWLVFAVSHKKVRTVWYIIPVILCAILLPKASSAVCGYQGNVTLEEGMPSELWIAMGMQEGIREAGWWNEYSENVFWEETAMDADQAKEIGKRDIGERLQIFRSDPAYAADFYKRKFVSQWNEPTYGCLVSTNAREEERGKLGDSLYKGELQKKLMYFMNLYQSVIYCGVLFFCILRFWKNKNPSIEACILIVIILGGVLFHILWEAKSRYSLGYFVMMLPMAAAGITGFWKNGFDFFTEEKV